MESPNITATSPEWLTTTNTLGIALLTSVVYYISSILSDPMRKLPGPSRLPFIGSVHHLDRRRPHISITELSKIHGPIFSIQILKRTFLAVNSFDLVWDVLVKRSAEFSGRIQSYRSGLCLGEDVFTKEGEVHTLRKKLLMKVMRSYGSGLVEMENLLSRANEAFLSHLDKNEGKTINIAELLGDYVCTVTTVLMYGEEFNFDDKAVSEVKVLTKAVLHFCSPTNKGSEVESFPILRKIPYIRDKYITAEDEIVRMKNDTIGARSDHYKRNFEMNKNENRGILHQVIDAMKKDLKEDGSSKYPDKFLEGIIMDLLLGAIETTRRTTTQILLELCKQPQYAIRVQQEIDSVIGRDRQPKLSDKAQMPFTEAVIDEALRILTLLPLLVHKTLQDVEIGGYRVPKDTPVFINVWAVQHDDEIFTEPFKFNPNRFLDENGHLLPHEHPIRKRSLPFGAGRRVCAGEVFAKSRLFLLLTTMLQNFDFTLCDESIDCDVRSYSNEVVLEVPEQVSMIFTHRK